MTGLKTILGLDYSSSENIEGNEPFQTTTILVMIDQIPTKDDANSLFTKVGSIASHSAMEETGNANGKFIPATCVDFQMLWVTINATFFIIYLQTGEIGTNQITIR